jgi:hypothetical protein
MLAVCLSPSWVSAQQTTQFTVSVQSAAVRLMPSTGSPVIGQAPRGMVLDVTRDIGAWVKVAWPEAKDGIGYVHSSMGALSRKTTLEERAAVAAQVSSTPEPVAAAVATDISKDPQAIPMSARTQYVAPPSHFVGIGGRLGRPTNDDYGVSARVWSRDRLGLQVDASRSSFLSDEAPGQMSSSVFTPSVIYSFRDRVSDDIWVRPYIGGGAAITRAKLKMGTPEDAAAPTETSLGYRGFGGGEITFPAVARFAISFDAGYLWSKDVFPGFNPKGVQFTLAGHWYVK